MYSFANVLVHPAQAHLNGKAPTNNTKENVNHWLTFLRFHTMKTLHHLTWGAGQGIEIIAQETGINPVKILVMPFSARMLYCPLLLNTVKPL